MTDSERLAQLICLYSYGDQHGPRNVDGPRTRLAVWRLRTEQRLSRGRNSACTPRIASDELNSRPKTTDVA